MPISPFTIYNASAGSGKTYTLVKEYLKILLSSESNYAFKHILAITFTNKAVAEMKSRILETLKRFSDTAILNQKDSMYEDICNDLQKTPEQIHEKAKAVLETILHNYSAFSISTIDGFTHRIIRTFARDLRLSHNFEVELDTNSLLGEAVDSLLSKAGGDEQLTTTLVNYALEKLDEDKSWNISYDLNDISKLLVKENNLVFLKGLKEKSLADFEDLKSFLKKRIEQLEGEIISKAKSSLDLIAESGLEHTDFNGGARAYLPNHMIKLSEGNFSVSFDSKWQEEIATKPLYPSRISGSEALTMDRIQPQLTTCFFGTKELIFQIRFYKNIYKNLTPLSVLNSINKEMEMLQQEENKLLISEFNTIISKEIKNQPTPFIYERLGEKFKHYFIDEFQDTSKLQWENLKPLISNSLEQEQNDQSGTLMLVGDAKQAIYRWRGGEADQFINLYSKTQEPFQVKQEVASLDFNYRSFRQIVDFNNRFFKYLSSNSFGDPSYAALYEYSKQNEVNPSGGFVQLEFLNIETDDDKDALYCDAVLKTIQQCDSFEYQRKDICILVRKNKEGIAISNYLTDKGIPVVSADTMLLSSSNEVLFILNLLTLVSQPKNQNAKADVLYYVATKNKVEDIHEFMFKNISLDLPALFKNFSELSIEITIEDLILEPLYDVVETIVRAFKLIETSDAFVQFFLDEVLSYSQRQSNNIKDFLDYFETKKDKLYITNSENDHAVRVMTIHKAKGLEFPIVIFPYAELNIYRQLKPQVWYPLSSEKFSGFDHTLIDYSQDISNYGDHGELIYQRMQSQLELDNLNLLYVALTRPIEQLYIISKNEGKSTLKTYSGLFIEFLKEHNLWEENQLVYSFGEQEKKKHQKEIAMTILEENIFISSPRDSHHISVVTKSGYLWDTAQAEAIEKGNIIHALLAKVKTIDDMDNAIQDFIYDGVLEANQVPEMRKIIHNIVSHDLLRPYFSKEVEVFNEREIISSQGTLFRPDRLVFLDSKKVVIIDYKTGEENPKHFEQLNSYGILINEMGLDVTKKILVYINEDITVKEF